MPNTHSDTIRTQDPMEFDTFETLLAAYREAGQIGDQMYFRAIKRRLVHEARHLARRFDAFADAMSAVQEDGMP